jgi:phosphoribosylformimino-5-aminoimidazole carboxamide ribotide isomerase
MEKATVFNASPKTQAQSFVKEGFEWLHLVDLNGAFEGYSVNETAIKEVRESIKLPIQLGGGIRTIEAVDKWISLGINRVILGTSAVKNPLFVEEAAKKYPNQIAIGIDARNGYVATEGWAEQSEIKAIDLAKKFEKLKLAAIIYTDINRDGAMTGVNIAETVQLAKSVSIPVIASGGVNGLEDIQALKNYENDGIIGVISGKAIYEGKIPIQKALSICKGLAA